MNALQNRLAVIDLGSNTFHLIIGERKPDGTLYILYQEKRMVKLAYGGISSGIIAPEAFERGVHCLKDFASTMATHSIPACLAIAVGTSAIRSAKNGAVFVETVRDLIGINIEVINGDTEAYYIYKGVMAALPRTSPHPRLIMDIGGGSVEFILADSQNLYFKKSLEIGGQRLMDRFMDSDPISPEAIKDLKSYLFEALQPIWEACSIHRPDVLVGSSGSFDTLCELAHHRMGDTQFEMDKSTFSSLTLEDFALLKDSLLSKNREQRMAMPGMIELRVDLIVVGCVLIEVVLQELNLSAIQVSNYSLKHGVLFSALQGEDLTFA